MADALTAAANGQAQGYSLADLQSLWIAAGGDAAMAPIMAAIGAAESSFGTKLTGDVYPGQGPTSFGIWQIHTRDQTGNVVNKPADAPYYNEQRLMDDPLYNAQAAVSVLKSQGLSAWSTYTNGSAQMILGPSGNAPYAPGIVGVGQNIVQGVQGLSDATGTMVKENLTRTGSVGNALLDFLNSVPGRVGSANAATAHTFSDAALSVSGFFLGSFLLVVGIIWITFAGGFDVLTSGFEDIAGAIRDRGTKD